MWTPPDEILPAARIWLICGNYGSGKTELSLNLALQAAKEGPCALVDLDIVNPYFRSAEREDLLREQGVRVLAPTFAGSTVDIPALPAQITSVFGTQEKVFFDVGGDDTGAAALGRYHPQMEAACAKMIFVINTLRPLTRDADAILDLMERVCARSRQKVYALCNNANAASATQIEDILRGSAITQEVAARAGIDLAFHGAAPHLLAELPQEMRRCALPVTPYMRPEFF